MSTQDLRAEIQRVTKPSGRRLFGEALRAKVTLAVNSLRRTGASQDQIAVELGVSATTVSRYLRTRVEIPVVREVAVSPCVAAVSKVTTPSGFEVEGLQAFGARTFREALAR